MSLAQVDKDEPIIPSSPTDVYIVEGAEYFAPIDDNRPIVHFFGVIYWERLANSFLNFFTNTSDVITESFWDYESGNKLDITDECRNRYGDFNQINACVTKLSDKYIIVPEARSFGYEITAYYDPDIVFDTGFIVIFNSQSVDFAITVEDQQVYAKVDYKNIITLPEGAGIVSYAPIDNGFLGLDRTDDGRWQVIWEYKHRAMDSKHDPLIIEVTYSYDEIYLKFTEQVYQNQEEQREREREENRLKLLNASFVVIATLAIVASIFSVLFAYLLAKKRFQPKLNQAKELPRRVASDIEKSESLKVPTKSLLLSSIIIIPLFIAPISVNGQVEVETIYWNGLYDLNKDLTLTETIEIKFPVIEDEIFVYINTSITNLEFEAFDEFGTELRYEEEENRFVVHDAGFYIKYIINRPYQVHNNSNMLVYLDRFWMEFFKPTVFLTSEDIIDEDWFFYVDLQYSVILPVGAYLYSASPSELLGNDVNKGISKTTTGRWNVTFTDSDRRMDAFHDVFETQITFSFISIIDAIDNLDTPFQVIQDQKQDLEEYIDVASSEILLFSILGIIAPLISFLIAYWVLRRRYQKLIERIEQQQEEQIFIEGPQIDALVKAVAKDANDRLYDSYIGHYWRLLNNLSVKLRRDVSVMENTQIIAEINKRKLKTDQNLLMEILSMGQSMSPDDAIDYGQLQEFNQLINEFLKEI